MNWKNNLFKPSTLCLFTIVVVFLIMAVISLQPKNPNPVFMTTGSDLIKILGGAFAGAYAGEKFVQLRENNG